MSKRDHILEAAEELFAEFGYDGTSVRALATKAGVNIAMISYYFGSKEKLFEALIEHRASFLREKLKVINKYFDDPVKRIEVVVDAIVERIFSNPGFHRMVSREISVQQRSEMTEFIVSVLMKNIDEVRKMINDGIKLKVFRAVDVDMVINSLFSTTSQVAQSSLFTTRLLGIKHGRNLLKDDSIKLRLKTYLKDFLKIYLLQKD